MGFSIDIDTGGTFTDGFIRGDGRIELVKVPTTPHDLTLCFMECIEEAARKLGYQSASQLLPHTDTVRLSTAICTNSLIHASAKTKAIDTCDSGPAAGLFGADDSGTAVRGIIEGDGLRCGGLRLRRRPGEGSSGGGERYQEADRFRVVGVQCLPRHVLCCDVDG